MFSFLVPCIVNLSPSSQFMCMLVCSPNGSANIALIQIPARAPAELCLEQTGQPEPSVVCWPTQGCLCLKFGMLACLASNFGLFHPFSASVSFMLTLSLGCECGYPSVPSAWCFKRIHRGIFDGCLVLDGQVLCPLCISRYFVGQFAWRNRNIIIPSQVLFLFWSS